MSVFKFHKAADTSSMYRYSAIPYVSSSIIVPESGSGTSPVKVEFPRLTKFVTVRNINGRTTTAAAGESATGSLRIGFSANGTKPGPGISNNFFVLDAGESYTGDWRVSEIYLYGNTTDSHVTASVIAGLSPVSTGSVGYNNWTGSLGVG